MVVLGLIRPPAEIRAVADRTASYVAKNGRAFENRILNSAKGKTPKFAFLQATSPFHAYYEERIQFYAAGGEDNKDEKEGKKTQDKSTEDKAFIETGYQPKEISRKKEKTKKASAIDPVAKALLAQRSKILHVKEGQEKPDGEEDQASALPNPPEPLELVRIVAPLNLSPAHLESIQLAAQFAALDGKNGNFLHNLTVKEWNNPTFSFLQPRHAHFAYFSALVDAYRRIFEAWTITNKNENAKEEAYDVRGELDEAAYRAEYQREMESQKSLKEDGELIAVDWHDFVVVETIEFPINEVVELSMLPPPPPAPPPASTSASKSASAGGKEDESMEESDEDEEEENIRVVPSYTPKIVGPTNLQSARAIDPISGKSVSVADMSEHMRIQLLDPKWAEERAKFQEKQKDSNLVSGDVVANNISRFAQARGAAARSTETPTEGAMEPAAKRMRQDTTSFTAPVPPPPPPPPTPIPQTGAALSPHRNDRPTSLMHISNPSELPVEFNGEAAKKPHGDPILGSKSPHEDSPQAEKKLLTEADFAASLPSKDVTLQIRIPNDPSQMSWNFYGQILSMTVDVMSKVKDIKVDLSRQHLNEMPANKIQFKDPQIGFLKDNMTLAALNVGPTATLAMKVKSRGGRK